MTRWEAQDDNGVRAQLVNPRVGLMTASPK